MISSGTLIPSFCALAAACRKSAIAIARTETTRLANRGVIEHYKDQGVKEVVWVASLGDRTCEICWDLNGRTFPIGEAPVPGDYPHIYCRCTLVNIEE